MTCSACSAAVEKSVRKLKGVNFVNVNLLLKSMEVEYDEKIQNSETIVKAVKDAGYGATLFSSESTMIVGSTQKYNNNNTVENEIKEMKTRLLVSFIFLIPLLYISMGHMFYFPLPIWMSGVSNAITFAFIQLLLTIPIIYVNRKYYQVGFKTLIHGSPNMDTLIAIGSTAALIYGIFAIFRIGYGLGHNMFHLVEQYATDLYFESAAMILTLITLGKYLEIRSKHKTSDAISKLLDLAPKTAFVVRNGVESEIPVEDISIDDIVLVKPGQSIPVDGIIVQGNSTVDQSALTGESIPVEKQIGDKVMAATVNKSGFLKFKAQKVGENTTLSRIIRLVEEASSSKAPIAKMADRISGVFVPAVISIAVVSTIIWIIIGQSFEFALSIGISVLVISCPCALGLATPVAIMVGTGVGASKGILIKSAEVLETAKAIKTVILDKTGTITMGKPQVTDIITARDVTEQELLEIAASIEKPSEHPLAEAIVSKAKAVGISIIETETFKAISGRGIVATIIGKQKQFFAGNLALMKEWNVDVTELKKQAEKLSDEAKTLLYFAEDNRLLGIIALADVVKPTSYDAIKRFKDMGIDVVMITGDNLKTAKAIQKQMKLNRVIAEVLPEDKEKEVRRIQESGKIVAMIGDGINDAPALARADVGIAIGAGTDIAIESADIVLMKSDLLDAVTAIKLSKATILNIKQNLFWAFFYNSLGIPLAAGLFYPLLGWKLNPMFAAAAMSLSSAFVVFNALRLRFFKAEDNNNNLEKTNLKSKEEKTNMVKEIIISGMSCEHCRNRVEKALNAISGVKTAQVDLEKNTALVTLSETVEDWKLKETIEEAGYEVVSIK